MKKTEVGIWSGIFATSVMTLALFELSKSKKQQLPPAKVTRDVLKPFNINKAISKNEEPEVTLISHFIYGIGCSLAYTGIQNHLRRPSITGGVAYGISVWIGSYFGLLPAMQSRAAAYHLPKTTNLKMLLAHIVWGASLGYSQKILSQHGEKMLEIT
jgi:uncharacterized membrane protein YagU involved in acid resistance